MSEEIEMSKKSTAKTKIPIDEGAVTSALRSRVAYFKQQADSLTLEGVRRVLEKDLGLEEYVLDSHKRFIKQCLQECFDAASNENISKSSAETGEEVIDSTKEETVDLSEKKPRSQHELKELVDKEEMQESPVMGLLAGADTARKGAEKTESFPPVKALSNETIEKAIRKRAAYFRSNSETITLAGARRLLEEDLKLEKHALDSYRECVKDQLDKVLASPTVAKSPANVVKNKKRKQISSEGSSDSEEEVKPKRKTVCKAKNSVKETKKSGNKPKKPVESISVESDGPKDDGDLSDDGHSQSSTEKPVKRRSEAPSQTYGKRVEHLRSIIRACGMSVPPNVYKRVKEAPESKREACLIKELEDMLKREGLSSNPSEKGIQTTGVIIRFLVPLAPNLTSSVGSDSLRSYSFASLTTLHSLHHNGMEFGDQHKEEQDDEESRV
ncbi:hypothetical protein ACHQM5_022749 [Ranunculus cassubicifolius]